MFLKISLAIFFYLICIIRTLLAPFILLLCRFIPAVSNRLKFEEKNLYNPASHSFMRDKIKAFVTFEVSSEGELEQIRPLLMEAIKDQHKVELIYCSESVENKCLKLYEDYPELIRIFRLPLLSFSLLMLPGTQNIKTFITSDTLVLCRYDFFPELMLHGFFKSLRFILVSATLKNKPHHFHLANFFYKSLYRQFHLILCATKRDKDLFQNTLKIDHNKLIVYDFRIIQILNRVKKASQILNSKIFYPSFKSWLNHVPFNHRIIFGSIWPLEMNIFKNDDFIKKIKNNQFRCVLAPHKLNALFLKEIIENLPSDLPYYVIDKDMDALTCQQVFDQLNHKPGILILMIPGILCELYTDTGNAYVGGGHGRSIHSVLEPYVGMTKVFCGPKTHRSTEYDLITDYSLGQIQIVRNLTDFYQIFLAHYEQEVDIINRTRIFNHFFDNFESISNQVLSKRDIYV